MADLSKYSIVVRTPDGKNLIELAGLAKNRQVIKSRNEPDEISWRLDHNSFCRAAFENKLDPASVLTTGRNEIRIYREGIALSGGQLILKEIDINPNQQTIDLKAVGFLNLLKDRFTSDQFSAVDASDIAWSLIDSAQQEDNGDFGITRGLHPARGLWNKVYDRASVKEALEDLSASQSRGFDMEVTYDKVFNIYAQQGSLRKDFRFEYPGNILGFKFTEDATNIANEIIGVGAGNGSEIQQVVTIPSEAYPSTKAVASQQAYVKRQKFLNRSSDEDADQSLPDATLAALNAFAFPTRIPGFIVNGAVFPFITSFGIGDRVFVSLAGSPLTGDVNGYYPTERLTLDIDDNDYEQITVEVSA